MITDGPPTPFHTTFTGRRVAASAPVPRHTLALLHEVGSWPSSVPVAPGRPTDAAARDAWHTDTFAVALDRRDPASVERDDACLRRGRAALWSYRMVDPAIVRAAWWADDELLGRRLVQEGRFGPLRLRMATEVVAVVDGPVTVAGRRATVVGFEYRTLAGHLEHGWQSWQLWRWHDTGVLEHRGHTTSRRGRPDNPVIDLGMRVFGRAMQLLAGRLSTARLAGFTRGNLGARTTRVADADVLSLASLPEAQRLADDAASTGPLR